jgi:hypothetical protein
MIAMRRVGLPDIAAALIVAAIILMPPKRAEVHHAYRDPATYVEPEPEALAEVARLQAEVSRSPRSAEAADQLAEALGEIGESDEALRVALAAVARVAEPRWRAELAVASAHSERIELEDARSWATRAIATCRESARCNDAQAVRMEIFNEELGRGLQAIADGIDPRLEPARFLERVRTSRPPVRIGP